MDDIREVVVGDYYPLGFTLDEIRSDYEFDVSCQGSVPQALEAFFESASFEDAIRNAISIGGDSDTIGAICGAVAGAYYGVPDEICAKAMTFLTSDLVETLDGFEHGIGAAR
jgi:type I restriction enzyme M protein